jgi:competence protein ComGC
MKKRNNSAFTVVEMVIVALLMGVSFLAVMNMMFSTSKLIIKGKYASQAYNLATEGIEVIRRLNYDFIKTSNVDVINDLVLKVSNNIDTLAAGISQFYMYKDHKRTKLYKFSYPDRFETYYTRTMTVKDYISNGISVMKEIKVKVTWIEAGDQKEQELSTIIFNINMANIFK